MLKSVQDRCLYLHELRLDASDLYKSAIMIINNNSYLRIYPTNVTSFTQHDFLTFIYYSCLLNKGQGFQTAQRVGC